MSQPAYQEILRHARRSYPDECCGVLLGDASGLVIETAACANRALTPRTRYQIAPADLVRLQREARSRQLQIAGFYHSHPDAEPIPSSADVAQAYWTGCWYVIAGAGEAESVRAFRLESEGRLTQQPLEVLAAPLPVIQKSVRPRGTGGAMAIPEITPEELKQKLDAREEVFILDVREPYEYQIANLDGYLIPLGQLPHRVSELDPDAEIVVHCRSGKRSADAAEYLQKQGFTKVRSLAGGILAWADRVDPNVKKY